MHILHEKPTLREQNRLTLGMVVDERPSTHTPFPLGHTNRIVEKFLAGVLAVQATGTVRVIHSFFG